MEKMLDKAIEREKTFFRNVPSLGLFRLRPFSIETDVSILHDWVNLPYASYWGLQGYSIEQVKEVYLDLTQVPDYQIYTGLYNEEVSFLMESYAPQHDSIRAHYEVKKGDIGMHVLVGPPQIKLHQFTWQVFRTIMDFLFSKPNVNRIVVEPDVRNEKIHRLNKRAGFQYDKEIILAKKTAHLAFCTRAQYEEALLKIEYRP